MKKLLLLFPLLCLTLGAAPATDLAFTGDGKTLISTGRKQIQVLFLATGRTEVIPCEPQRVVSLDVDPKSRFVVIGGGSPGENGSAAVLDWQTKRVLQHQTNFSDWVTCVTLDPHATRFVAGSADASARLYPVSSAAEKDDAIALKGHTGPVLGAAWSPDAELVVTASADRSLKVWASADGRLLRSFAHHTEAVHTVVFRPGTDSSALAQCASGSDDETVRIWQPKIGRMVRIIRGHGGATFALAYTPDGSALFSAGKEGIIRCLDPDSDRILGEWKAHEEAIYSLAIDSAGTLLASGDWSGAVKLWRFTSGKLEAVP